MAQRTMLYAAAAALCALVASGASAQPASYVIQADNKIAGFAVKRDGTLGGAVDEFGTPTRYRRDRTGWNGCILNWSGLGLQIFFYNLGGRNPCSPSYGYFRDAILTGRQWRTASGLRIGHPARLILRYHPRAKRDPRARNWWWLVTRTTPYGDGGSYAALTAKVQRGRVSAFAVYHQSGGE
jgi:hypothetical protein